MRSIRLLGFVLLASLILLPVAPAGADSIVYLNGGNVFIAQPDGAGQQQVTQSGGFTGVSQSDNGTIVASNGNQLFRIDHGGEPYNPPFEVRAHDWLASGDKIVAKQPFEPAVSPDGSKVGYQVFTTCVPGPSDPPSGRACTRGQYSASDHFSNPEDYSARDATNDRDHPAWIGNSRTMLFGPPSVNLLDPAPGASTQPWFNDSDLVNFVEGDLSADGAKLAVVRGADSQAIRLFLTNGPPPSAPTPICDLVGATGGSFFDPSWSPDASSLTWAEGDGTWTGRIDVTSGGCNLISQQLVFAGATEPDWGPAEPGSNVKPPDPVDVAPPNTVIQKHPKKSTDADTATFTFTSTEASSTFDCALVEKNTRRALARFKPCTSPKRYRKLDEARYTFQVRATDAAGNTDPSAAKFKWEVGD